MTRKTDVTKPTPKRTAKRINPSSKRKSLKKTGDPAPSGVKPKRKTTVPRLPKVDGVVARPAIHDELKIALTVDNVDFFKNSDCAYYVQCMNHVAKKGWNQFHCRACKIYNKDSSVDEQIRAALERIGDFT